jgi:osmoprotectant transport system ATP-binding protein
MMRRMQPAPVGKLAIELKGVGKRFGATVAVQDVSLGVERGTTFCFIGPSGCGKSTTLKMINRLVEPSSGSVLVDDRDVATVDASELRRGIGYVIQDVGLFPHYTVARNVGLVPEIAGWTQARMHTRVRELLGLVGLPEDEFGHRYPDQLSGGQRQRVGIARALAADPPIVLLDEPFSALDPISRERLQSEFLVLSRRLRKTFVMVTHDIREGLRLADRVGVMGSGRLVQCGTPREIVERPSDERVVALLGRDRYRLRLMTLPVAELCGPAQTGAERPRAPDGDVLGFADDASVWDALEAMETSGATWLRIGAGASARWMTRSELLGALGNGRRDGLGR